MICNKSKAVEVLAAVFGGGSEKVGDGQMEDERVWSLPCLKTRFLLIFRTELF